MADSIRIHFELEELMGGGRWEPVLESMEEADYGWPDHRRFTTADEARTYAKQRWSKPQFWRLVEVTTVRKLVPEVTVTIDEHARFVAEMWDGPFGASETSRIANGIGPSHEAAIWAVHKAHADGSSLVEVSAEQWDEVQGS